MGIPDVPADARPIVPSVHRSLGPKFAVLAVVARRPAIDTPAGGVQTPTPVADRTPTPLDGEGQLVTPRGGGR